MHQHIKNDTDSTDVVENDFILKHELLFFLLVTIFFSLTQIQILSQGTL
jgi:hypothetical protein